MHAGALLLPSLCNCPGTSQKRLILALPPGLLVLINAGQGPYGPPIVVLLHSPTLAYCPWSPPSIPQPDRLHSRQSNGQLSHGSFPDVSGKVPGRGQGAGRAGGEESGLRALCALLLPAIGPSLLS
jgi:hypothetical protein